jgi:hypothetical protein
VLHVYLTFLDATILFILCEEYKLRSSFLCSFSNLLSFQLSSVQIYFLSLSSRIPSFNVRHQASHPCRITDKIILLCSELDGSKRYQNTAYSYEYNFFMNSILICYCRIQIANDLFAISGQNCCPAFWCRNSSTYLDFPTSIFRQTSLLASKFLCFCGIHVIFQYSHIIRINQELTYHI